MKRNSRIGLIVSLCLMLFMVTHVSAFGQLLPVQKKESRKISDTEKKGEKIQLTIDRVVKYLLEQNLDVKKAVLDYKIANSELLRYDSRYDTGLYGKTNYSSARKAPDDPSARFQGSETISNTYEVGASRSFSTGTRIKIAVNSLYQNVKGAEINLGSQGSINLGGEGYQSDVAVSLSQELLKNPFGINDRLNEEMIGNSAEIQKRLVTHYLASLLVEALVGYWNVSVAEQSLETARIGYTSTVSIRDLVERKRYLGLSETEEVLDWNSKVFQSKNTLDIAEKNLYEARLAVVRILNLKSGTAFDIGTIFQTTPPEVSFEQAMKDAFAKRVDIRNQRTVLDNSRLEYRIASNNAYPSMQLNLSAGNKDYSQESYSGTFDDINRQWSVGLEMTYPLGNTEAEVKIRDAVINNRRNEIGLKNLERTVRDEIDMAIRNCGVLFSVYQQTKKSQDFSKKYYYQVLRRFRLGKYDSVQLKLALDSYIGMRQSELKSLVDYNVALLRRDLSRYVIFENYNIDINTIMEREVKKSGNQ
ncbi:MAG TPA: TolC family protein [Spirochaetota bacterium]|nr:TolC family protein [Spirochaetota bacterium]